MKEKPVANIPDEWVKLENVIPPLIDNSLFLKANDARNRRRERMSDRYMLDRLRFLLKKKGFLSADLLGSTPSMPSVHTYRDHFGSLSCAYKAIGYDPCRLDHPFLPRRLRKPAHVFREDVATALTAAGGIVERAPGGSMMLVDGRHRVEMLVARTVRKRGTTLWQVRLYRDGDVDMVLVGLIPHGGGRVESAYLLPRVVFRRSRCLQIGARNLRWLARYKLDYTVDLYPRMLTIAAETSFSRSA